MTSLFSHTYVALSIGSALAPSVGRARFLILSVVTSTLPDADVLGFRLGVAYGDLLGHRGLTHSLPFALVIGLLVVGLAYRAVPRFGRLWWGLLAWFTLLTASHGFQDALTDGGLGVAFFSPFDPSRYFLPWTPILVSPIGIESFFTPYGWAVLRSEILVVWLPATMLTAAIGFTRYARTLEARR